MVGGWQGGNLSDKRSFRNQFEENLLKKDISLCHKPKVGREGDCNFKLFRRG